MAEHIEFSVDIRSEIAVYQQIENQVKFALVSGALQPGDPLPSVRELASLTGVNANTVTKAYRDLELMRLIVTRRGVGVKAAPGAARACKAETLTMVRRHIRMAVGECLASGVSEKEIKSLVQQAINRRVGPYDASPLD
jgi:GntR family transcriptional regulator